MIEAHKLTRTFTKGEVVTPVLKGVDFTAETGEFVAIMGRSGAGKSTLMYQLSLLDEPSSGKIVIDHKDISRMSEEERVKYRLLRFGYVFQEYALLPELTAQENVALPLLMLGRGKHVAYAASERALERVGLGHRLSFMPSQLSGGEQQRVSIARAVAHEPAILFADEPTANLDNESAKTVMGIFAEIHKGGQTIIMVTHEREYALKAERIVFLDDGKIVKEERPRHGG